MRDLKKEIEVIKKIGESLETLNEEERRMVIEYIAGHPVTQHPGGSGLPFQKNPEAPIDQPPSSPVDIRSLKETKNPQSANEMAVLVAYYLSDIVKGEGRKPAIDSTDIVSYFKQAGYPLSKKPEMTLPHAKDAGYFDATTVRGQYKLNPVGYNLAVHAMPTSASSNKKAGKRKSKRSKK